MKYRWEVREGVHYVVSESGCIFNIARPLADGTCMVGTQYFIDLASAKNHLEASYHFGANAHGVSGTPKKGRS